MDETRARFFTVDEANALIPRLEMVMERMQRRGIELRDAIRDLSTQIGRPPRDTEIAELLERLPDLRAAATELEELIEEIEAYGAQFKGIDLGLVDFPSEVNGQFALLCWQYGEKEITHWHTEEDGFAGREPLTSADRTSYLQ
jgi:hypothetical protein